MVTEYTIASTGQILNPYTRKIDTRLLEKTGINPGLFNDIVMPGHRTGVLKDGIAAQCGLPCGIPVVAVAGHDTASAVAAVPARTEKFAYLSSGTWSLMGIETPESVINASTSDFNITNEGGVFGTIRLLKNITGMWILENCLSEWHRSGSDYSYEQITDMAGGGPRFTSLIDPDDSIFASPRSMTEAIATYCRRTGQTVPQTHSDFVCCIFESLALKYRYVLETLGKISGRDIDVLHIIGGGSKNALLNRYTANATGLKVVAGPS